MTMPVSNQDFLARAEELAAQWRALALEIRALLVEAWDTDVDVRPLQRALVAGRRGNSTRDCGSAQARPAGAEPLARATSLQPPSKS
jgi:hypothetical protein